MDSNRAFLRQPSSTESSTKEQRGLHGFLEQLEKAQPRSSVVFRLPHGFLYSQAVFIQIFLALNQGNPFTTIHAHHYEETLSHLLRDVQSE